MNKHILLFLLCLCTGFSSFAKKDKQEAKDFFPKNELMTVGTYYYPEHWDPSQWERDIKNMADMGFEFTHFAEFAWAQLEPKEGVYNFKWLDKVLDLCRKYNLKVVLCTSTATPPAWLTRKYPEIREQQESGFTLDHGARQHASFSSTLYREYSIKMIKKLARRYGKDPIVIGWQIDNEPRIFEDHSQDAQIRFREWLQERYDNNIKLLNKNWGTAFWSQIYNDFEQINIPQTSVRFMNPHQVLDYKRFTADETASFIDEQAEAIRKNIKPFQWITTNYIPTYEDGHLNRSKKLSFHSYTRYMVFGENYGIGRKGYRIGPVERIAMANDFFRPMDNLYGVMELQPGQVNWGSINPQPLPGAVRMWIWHVFAGGGRFTCAYRYRQPLYGTELYHYGIVGSDGVTPTLGGLEYKQTIEEIAKLRKLYNPKKPNMPADHLARRTAILYNVENTWDMQRNKQTTQWNTLGHIEKYYNALKQMGAPVDFIAERQLDTATYKVMIVPAYQLTDRPLIEKWRKYVEKGGHLVLTCRTGHKQRNGQLWETPYAEPIYELIGARIPFYDHLLPHTPDQVVMDEKQYNWTSWGEGLDANIGTEVWGNYKGDFYEGTPAITHRKLGKGSVTYIGVDSQKGDLEEAVLRKLYQHLSIPVLDLPDGVHIEYRDGFGIAVNYSDQPYMIPILQNAKIVIGENPLKTADVLVWQE